MPQPKTATVIRQIGLSETLARRAEQQAAQLGLSTPEYIRYLIAQAGQHTTTPREKISEQAEKRYFKELIQFLKSEEKNPTPAFTSAEELIQYLDRI